MNHRMEEFANLLLPLLFIMGLAWLSACSGTDETPSPPAQQSSGSSGRINDNAFQVIERKMVNDALYISLGSSEDLADMDDSRLLRTARELVSSNPDEYMIRIFFYNPGDNPRDDIARICYQWTEDEGLLLNFDFREMGDSYTVEAEESNDDEEDAFSMPEYTILDTVPLMIGGKHGDVLIQTYSPDTATDILRETAINIAGAGGFTSLSLYSTEEAYRASYSASYSNEHPGALEKGYLGRYENGEFYPPM